MFNEYDLRYKADVSATELEYAVNKLKKDNGLKGLYESFLEAQEKYNVNAIILLSIACLESGYGLSELAKLKNNLFGIAAYDDAKRTEEYGSYFNTKKDSIMRAGDMIGNEYLSIKEGVEWKYRGGRTDIYSVGELWCSQSDWGYKVSDIAARIQIEIMTYRKLNLSDYINIDSTSENISETGIENIDYKEKYLEYKNKFEEADKKYNDLKAKIEALIESMSI